MLPLLLAFVAAQWLSKPKPIFSVLRVPLECDRCQASRWQHCAAQGRTPFWLCALLGHPRCGLCIEGRGPVCMHAVRVFPDWKLPEDEVRRRAKLEAIYAQPSPRRPVRTPSPLWSIEDDVE